MSGVKRGTIPNDLIGRRFSRLLVYQFLYRTEKSTQYWECLCDCGVLHKVARGNLLNGHASSCGCFRREDTRTRVPGRTHGHSSHKTGRTRVYRSWSSMMERCYKTWCKDYKYYGARGITVSKRWHQFENFLIDMGERPVGKTLDRINNSGNYSKQNCRWATYKEQANNRRPPGGR